ncbi:hypothetical protein Gotri_026362, partial [Gossypium trilobum]|nr:hypothetical protein [Gossypium trilobum]
NHWLLGPSNCNIQDSNVRVDITQVSKLIDEHTRTWNKELIRSIFTFQEANRIMFIPLAQIRCNDKVVLRGERTSEYTMRSGCKLLIEERLILQYMESGTMIWPERFGQPSMFLGHLHKKIQVSQFGLLQCFHIVVLLCASVTGCSSKLMTIAQNASHEGLSVR